MFEKTEIRRAKAKLQVSLTLTTGESVEGSVFVSQGQRLADILNDERAFIPVDLGEGRITVTSKSAIASAKDLGSKPVLSEDPHKLLRVDPRVPDGEVREAWMAALKASHPDRLAALGMHPHILAAAREVSQMVNGAYDDIMRDRRAQRGHAA